MLDLLDSLTSENLVLICLVLGVIALCLAVGISVEIYTANKKYQRVYDRKTNENTQTKLNIKESANVIYVEEDDELEKTKAKMELEQLRAKLKKEEEEKRKIIEENIILEKENKEKEFKIETLEDTIVDLQPVVNQIKEKELIQEKEEKVARVIANTNVEELEKTKEIVIPSNTEEDYQDEDTAIISYEELQNAKNNVYTDEEMYNNLDEEDAIISMQELEKLYHESDNIEVNEKDNKEELNNNVSTSSYDSSIYGYSKTDQDLILEQTANLEKLNEEIRKTNEFLKMLKDLKKNLE